MEHSTHAAPSREPSSTQSRFAISSCHQFHHGACDDDEDGTGKFENMDRTRATEPHSPFMAARDPQAVLDCRSADGVEALSLPGPNWALPVDVSMRPEEPRPAGELPESLREQLESLKAADGIQVPVCLRDDSHLRLWHCQDASFGIPKVRSKIWIRAYQVVPCF